MPYQKNMSKVKKYHRFTFCVLIFLFILTLIFLEKKNIISIGKGKKTRLPYFVTTDVLGNKIKSADLKGKYLYVQFIQHVDDNNINLFNKVYSNCKEKNLRFLIIAKRYDQIKSHMNINPAEVAILINEYDKLKKLFAASEYGTHYLFDDSGLQIFSEQNFIEYEKGIKKYIVQAIDKDTFSISKFIKENENISNLDWFEELSHFIHKENYDYYVISMFSSFSDTCVPGTLIQFLKKVHLKYKKSTYVLCILSDKYGKDDITIFKSQLRIPFPVIKADGLLSQKWKSFINHYNEADLNNIVFLLDNSGHILKVLDPSCKNCWNPFYSELISLVRR